MSGGRRKRILTPDEVSLWSHVTRHVAPIHVSRAKSEQEPPLPAPILESPAPPPEKAPTRIKKGNVPASTPVMKPTPDIPPLAPLERRLRQRLSRGAQSIDSVIDLHGKRQDEAHALTDRVAAALEHHGRHLLLTDFYGIGDAVRSTYFYYPSG